MKSTASFWKTIPRSISRLYHMTHMMVLQQIMRLKLPEGCELDYPGMDNVGEFILTIKPKEGLWKRGVFKFAIIVPENYGYQSPTVTCLTKIWHPGIDMNGRIVLQLEKTTGRVYDSGPSGVSKLMDIIWEIDALFTVCTTLTFAVKCG